MSIPFRRWIRFFITDVFWGITPAELLFGIALLSSGTLGMVRLYYYEITGWGGLVVEFYLYLGSSALLGAGLLAGIREKAAGAMSCVAVALTLLLVVMVIRLLISAIF